MNEALLLCVYFFTILTNRSTCVPLLNRRPSTSNELCAPGFENIVGFCQPCKPRYFKDSTMTGMNCAACDYERNQFQVEHCPCTSVQNSVIVCRNDSIAAPSLFCKKKSEVHETCAQQGELENPQRETNPNDILSGTFTQSSEHHRSSTSPLPSPITTIAPVDDHQPSDQELLGSTLNVMLAVLITTAILIAIVPVVFITRTGVRARGRQQPFDAAINAEQADQLLPAAPGAAGGCAPPANLRMREIEANPEDPHTSVSSDSDPAIEDSRDLSFSVASLSRPFDTQLDFENSVALRTNPVSDGHTVNPDVASVLPQQIILCEHVTDYGGSTQGNTA